MIPLKDDAPRIGIPYVTYVLLALNTLAFLFELQIGSHGRQNLDFFIFQFGVVPARFTVVLFNHGYVPWDLISQLGTRYVPPLAAILPIFTSMFLHGGWLHLIFNMWALWIFGDNVEDYLGHSLYLVLYFVCGIAAALLHTLCSIFRLDCAQRGSQRRDRRGDGRVLPAVSAGARADPGAVLLRVLHVAAGVDRAGLLVCRAVSQRGRHFNRGA